MQNEDKTAGERSDRKNVALTDKNKRFAYGFLALVLLMVALSYAAVPFYRVFCQITGYGGTTKRAEAASAQIIDRDMKIRFDANLNQDMPWQFSPKQHSQMVKIGAQHIAFFEAYNPTDKTITGTATFNVTPFKAGGYFAKIDCFCFTEQTLKAGERVDMPVTYYIDPAIIDDHELDDVREITLSYTFFNKADAVKD